MVTTEITTKLKELLNNMQVLNPGHDYKLAKKIIENQFHPTLKRPIV